MSTTIEAIEIIDQLVEAKIPKETAKELISFVEKQRGDLVTKQDLRAEIEPLKQGQQWLKWVMGGVVAVMIGGFALLNQRIESTNAKIESVRAEMKAEVRELKAEMENRLNKMEQRNIERHRELTELLQRGGR